MTEEQWDLWLMDQRELHPQTLIPPEPISTEEFRVIVARRTERQKKEMELWNRHRESVAAS
jgi:hypothetical protein